MRPFCIPIVLTALAVVIAGSDQSLAADNAAPAAVTATTSSPFQLLGNATADQINVDQVRWYRPYGYRAYYGYRPYYGYRSYYAPYGGYSTFYAPYGGYYTPGYYGYGYSAYRYPYAYRARPWGGYYGFGYRGYPYRAWGGYRAW